MTDLIDLIALELGISHTEVRSFVLEVCKINESSIDYDDILSVLRQIRQQGKRAATPRAVAALLRAQNRTHLVPTSSPEALQEKSLTPEVIAELKQTFYKLEQENSRQQSLEANALPTLSQPLQKPRKEGKTTPSRSPGKAKTNPTLTTQPRGKIVQIAAELKADVKTANGFVEEVRQLLGEPVKFGVILDALRQINSPNLSSVDAVTSLISSQKFQVSQVKGQKSKPITKAISILQPVANQSFPRAKSTIDQIAKELNIDIKSAKNFVDQIRQLFVYPVKDKQILGIIRKIEDRKQITPQTVASLLIPTKKDTLAEIATELNVHIKAAEAFIFQVRRLCGNNVKQKEILGAIKQIKNRGQITPDEVVSILSSNKTSVSLKEVKRLETQATKPVLTSSILIEDFEANRYQSTQALFAELELWLETDQARLKARDSSIFTFDSSLLDGFAQGQTCLQGLADQAIARQEFDKLVQVIILLIVSGFSSDVKLESGAAAQILNAIAIDMARNGQLLSYIGWQLTTQIRQRKQVNRFVHHVLLNLYYKTNLIQDKRYIAHLDGSGRPYFKVLPSQKLATFYTFADHAIWTFVWQLSSVSLPLLLPDVERGETWVGQTDIPNAFHTSPQEDAPIFDTKALLSYGRNCYTDLQNERRYQVPSQGRAEIITSDRLKNLIGLNSVRFVQEDIDPPGILLRFEFGFHWPAIGLVRINKDGSTEGFHEFVWLNNSFRAIIEAVALAYYRDLVTPGKVYYYESGSNRPRTRRPPNPMPPKPKRLPRPQYIPLHARNNSRLRHHPFYHLHTWHEAQERARHGVRGHVRWIGDGFIASEEKQQQAWEAAGIELLPGATWVIEHERGGPGCGGLRLTQDGRLTERTQFLPSEQTSTKLDELLP